LPGGLSEGITVPATLTFTNVGDYFFTPLRGTVTIDAPGWNVTGSFALDAACTGYHASSAH
jgi:hypothetical protein